MVLCRLAILECTLLALLVLFGINRFFRFRVRPTRVTSRAFKLGWLLFLAPHVLLSSIWLTSDGDDSGVMHELRPKLGGDRLGESGPSLGARHAETRRGTLLFGRVAFFERCYATFKIGYFSRMENQLES